LRQHKSRTYGCLEIIIPDYLFRKGHHRMNGRKHLKLITNRLELIAATLDHICAELESPGRLSEFLNARVEQVGCS